MKVLKESKRKGGGGITIMFWRQGLFIYYESLWNSSSLTHCKSVTISTLCDSWEIFTFIHLGSSPSLGQGMVLHLRLVISHHCQLLPFLFFFFVLVGLGLEFRASWLQSRHSAA
jgi:hypothetical protein